MDTQNDGLEKVTPFKYGYFWKMNILFDGGPVSGSMLVFGCVVVPFFTL